MLQRYHFAPQLPRPPIRVGGLPGLVLRGSGLVVLLFITATVVAQLAFADRIRAGVSVLDVDIGGRTRPEAAGLLQARASSLLRQPVILKLGDRQWESTPRDLGLQVDTDALLDEAYGVGRDGTLIDRIADQWAALFRIQRLTSNGVDVDEEQMAAALQRIATEVDAPARNAHLRLGRSGTVDSVSIVPEETGVVLSQAESADRVRRVLTANRFPATVELASETTAPSLKAADLQEAKGQAEVALASPLVLTFEDRRWSIERDDIVKLIGFDRLPGQPVRAALKPEALMELLANISREIEQPMVDARFSWSGGRMRVIRDSQEGHVLDSAGVTDQIRDRLFTTNRVISLTLVATPPRVSSNDGPNLGVGELVAQGKTAFAGSVTEKQQNIALAASRLNGVVVPPGGLFSFNKEVGPTTLASGFKTGWGITLSKTGAQTIPSVAGGICQVATTLFHPLFQAGYAIEERHSHLYWIPSYGQPPLGMKGLDATVDEDYGLDLQFINTTPDYMLIQSRVENTNLIFELYGTKPTWDVKIEGPVITNVVPTDRAQMRQPEASMPGGRSLQVEGAQDGFDVTITRTVTLGDDVRTLPLKSHYVPSHNVVLYGTGPS